MSEGIRADSSSPAADWDNARYWPLLLHRERTQYAAGEGAVYQEVCGLLQRAVEALEDFAVEHPGTTLASQARLDRSILPLTLANRIAELLEEKDASAADEMDPDTPRAPPSGRVRRITWPRRAPHRVANGR